MWACALSNVCVCVCVCIHGNLHIYIILLWLKLQKRPSAHLFLFMYLKDSERSKKGYEFEFCTQSSTTAGCPLPLGLVCWQGQPVKELLHIHYVRTNVRITLVVWDTALSVLWFLLHTFVCIWLSLTVSLANGRTLVYYMYNDNLNSHGDHD